LDFYGRCRFEETYDEDQISTCTREQPEGAGIAGDAKDDQRQGENGAFDVDYPRRELGWGGDVVGAHLGSLGARVVGKVEEGSGGEAMGECKVELDASVEKTRARASRCEKPPFYLHLHARGQAPQSGMHRHKPTRWMSH
jgi:hypothetical protein